MSKHACDTVFTGQDIELENGYDNDNAADSDIHSDEDLPLPDDSHSSHLSQNAEHETSQYSRCIWWLGFTNMAVLIVYVWICNLKVPY